MIFDRQFQLAQPIGVAYLPPANFDKQIAHTNEVRFCDDKCQCETVHAVSHLVETYIGGHGTKLVTRTMTQYDCLICTNTHGTMERTVKDIKEGAA